MDTWLITGGAGFIGSNFVRHALAETNARIVVFDKLTYAGNPQSLAELANNPRFHFIQADIANRGDVEHVIREHQPTAIVNVAAALKSWLRATLPSPRASERRRGVASSDLSPKSSAMTQSIPPWTEEKGIHRGGPQRAAEQTRRRGDGA